MGAGYGSSSSRWGGDTAILHPSYFALQVWKLLWFTQRFCEVYSAAQGS
jgi:hypothetical protein